MSTIPTEQDPLVVTASDGSRIACWVTHVETDGLVPFGAGRRSGALRWTFVDDEGKRYVGPLFLAPESPERVRVMVDQARNRDAPPRP